MPVFTPNHHFISNLVYAANGSCVDTVICDGKILMEGKHVPGEENIMSVRVPKIEIEEEENSEIFPYSFASTSSELDASVKSLRAVMVKLIKLAEVEKTCAMLADEIEKTRRRVNALEYVMIPDYQETIKYISMKLDENERANTIRLMKVKQMLDEGQN